MCLYTRTGLFYTHTGVPGQRGGETVRLARYLGDNLAVYVSGPPPPPSCKEGETKGGGGVQRVPSSTVITL
jgi:hypothetical protein